MSEELSEEQIKNWRRVLSVAFGQYALLMPKEQIQLFRDRMASGLTKQGDGTEALSEEMESNGSATPKSRRHPLTLPADEFCTCDPKRHGATRHMDDSITCNKCGKTRR